jgi:thiamine-monophosphate kinase
MIDVSDGLALDLRRLADASGVGVALDAVPVAEGASWDDALARGEDYELVFAAPDRGAVLAAFAGLEPPIEIGVCTDDPAERRLGDGPLPEGGWQHQW